MSRRIDTSRLVLRPWENSDIADAVSIYTAPPVARWLMPQPDAIDSAGGLRAELAKWCDENRADPGYEGHWAVLERDSADVIGGLSLQLSASGWSG